MIKINHSRYLEKFPNLNEFEDNFIKSLNESIYDYTLERLSDGRFNIWTNNHYYVGKLKLRGKTHYLAYMKNEYNLKSIDSCFEDIILGISELEKYISKYLKV